MDNDAAGVAAIERLCTSQIIHGVVEENPILAVSVASLPQGVKDPDEYVMTQLEENDDDEQIVAQKFHEDVTSTACDWKMWYLRRLSIDHERDTAIDAAGEKKGMGTSKTDGGNMLLLLPLPEICDKASDFLSTLPLEKDRSQMSSDFAAWLTAARKVTADASSESASENSPSSDDEASRFSHKASAIRLETDLFSLSNKKARMKEFKASQRAKHSEGEDDQNYFGPWPEAARKSAKQMGNVAKSDDDDYYGPWPDAAPERNDSRNHSNIQRRQDEDQRQGQGRGQYGGNRSMPSRRQHENEEYEYEQSIPHFAGLNFVHPEDEEWIGSVEGSQVCILNGCVP
jgi:DNA primase